MRSWFVLGPVEVLRHLPAQDVRHQRRLAGSAHARHRYKRAERYRDVDVLQVVGARPTNHELLAVSSAPSRRHWDLFIATQVRGRERVRIVDHLLDRPRGDDLATMLAGCRPDVDHVVGRSNRLLVMLDHDQRVAQVAQPQKRVDQPAVVALVEADRWLVEDVQDPHQLGTDLSGEPDPLRLSARERVRGPLDGQVLEPDVDHELQPLSDLFHDPAGDQLLAIGEWQVVEEVDRSADRKRAHVRDVAIGDRDRERLRLQAAPLARRAWLVRHVALQLGLQEVRLRLLVTTLQVRDHALERSLVPPLVAVLVLVTEPDLLVAGAVEQHVLVLLADLRPRLVHVDPEVLAHRLEKLGIEELRFAPGRDRALP